MINICDEKITKTDKCTDAIKNMKLNKIPGADELSVECDQNVRTVLDIFSSQCFKMKHIMMTVNYLIRKTKA